MEPVTLDWQREGELFFAPHDGQWFVATNRSPWFCFSAATKDEARTSAESALALANRIEGTGD